MSDTPTPSSRPWHLWLLGLFGLPFSAFGIFDYLMTVTRNAAYLGQFPKEMVDYYFGLPWWIYAIWAVGLAGGLVGSFALLTRCRSAVALLGLALLSTLFSLVTGLTDPNVPHMEGAAFIAAAITGFSAFSFVYALIQRRRGVVA